MAHESKVLFLGKANDEYTSRALRFCRLCFSHVDAHVGVWGQPLPQSVAAWNGDYVISFLSRWIVPADVLADTRVAAINFHPGPPEYPGIGCNNFALYDDADEYGVTCHHMVPEVDTGPIVDVRRFSILPGDSVATLLSRTYDTMMVQLYELVGGIRSGKSLPASTEMWRRKPYTRDEFEKLSRIDPGMSSDEIARRVRATSFRQWQPTIEVAGFSFDLRAEDGED